METLGDRIKLLRIKKGLSLKDLSSIIGISDTAISKIETGKTRNIAIETGKEISKALGVSFNELFEIEDVVISDESSYVEEIATLRKELESVKEDLDTYKMIVSILKQKRMITSPMEAPKDVTEYEFVTSKTVFEEMRRRKEFEAGEIEEIEKLPAKVKAKLVKLISDGFMSKEND